MPKHLIIELPDGLSDQAEVLAQEAAIVALQQAGELSIRAAARLLGLSYESYLALLYKRQLPAANGESDPEALEGFLALAAQASSGLTGCTS